MTVKSNFQIYLLSQKLYDLCFYAAGYLATVDIKYEFWV